VRAKGWLNKPPGLPFIWGQRTSGANINGPFPLSARSSEAATASPRKLKGD